MKSKWKVNEMRKAISFIKWNSFFKWKGQTSTFGCNFHIFSITYLFFQKKNTWSPFIIEQTQHVGREGEQQEVSMFCLQATVCFSSAIDGQSVSAVIVRGLCDVCNNINAVTIVTDEQNARSLCPPKGPANLVAVRIPRLSVRRRQTHMYPRSSAPSDV